MHFLVYTGRGGIGRASCKIHCCVEQGIEVTKYNKASELAKEELSLLDISDVTYVYDFVKTISD